MTAVSRTATARAVPPWRDARVLRIAGQVGVLVVVCAVLAWMAGNFVVATERFGLGFGFRFLGRQAGFGISDSLIPYSSSATYATAFLVGVVNTLFVSSLGIVLATILGIAVGVARLSPNWLLSRLAAGYVELMRNTPLLLQLVVLYFVVFVQLPSVRDSIALGDAAFLNQRGLYLPSAVLSAGFGFWIASCLTGIVVLVASLRAAGRLEKASRASRWLRMVGIAAVLLLPAASWLAVGGAPLTFEVPVLGRFNFDGGIELSTAFLALLTGLVIYTAAFIGEVVRGAIQAVRHGQLEAARALGLSEGQVLRLVIFPQALRIIVPPLTSQYLNLTKNSSLAIAVGYADLFSIGQTMSNQTGQPVPVIMLVMGTYLVISLTTSALMNVYNRRVQVTER
jgi:general L-amino acid transport system permease protein